jgi:transcriptional regulator with GAF, ATPase, and Fis domain
MQETDRAEMGLPWPVILDEVTGALEALIAALDRDEELEVLLYRVCEQVVRAVPGVDYATVTLLDGDSGSPRTAATTSTEAAVLDREQYITDLGPCVEAARTGQLVRVAVDEAEQRWPSFARDARAAGMGSFLSAPLVVNHAYQGAINCYGLDGHGFAEINARLLELYTTAVEAGLRTHHRYREARQQAEHLRTALQSHTVIDEAKGILMAARSISADEAITLLVEQSQRDNVKLRDLAQQFVTQNSQPPNHADGEPTDDEPGGQAATHAV